MILYKKILINIVLMILVTPLAQGMNQDLPNTQKNEAIVLANHVKKTSTMPESEQIRDVLCQKYPTVAEDLFKAKIALGVGCCLKNFVEKAYTNPFLKQALLTLVKGDWREERIKRQLRVTSTESFNRETKEGEELYRSFSPELKKSLERGFLTRKHLPLQLLENVKQVDAILRYLQKQKWAQYLIEEELLFAAARLNKVNALSFFLERGISPNASMAYGLRLMHSAAAAGAYDTLKLLIEHGASVNIKSVLESTPLLRGVCSGKKEIVELLMTNGAQETLNYPNYRNRTPLDMANRLSHAEIATYLRSIGAK